MLQDLVSIPYFIIILTTIGYDAPGNLSYFWSFGVFSILMVIFTLVLFLQNGAGAGNNAPPPPPFFNNFNYPEGNNDKFLLFMKLVCVPMVFIIGYFAFYLSLDTNFHIANHIMSQIGMSGRFSNIFNLAVEGLLSDDERLAFLDYLEVCETLRANERRFFFTAFNRTYSNFGYFSTFDECRMTLDVFYKIGKLQLNANVPAEEFQE